MDIFRFQKLSTVFEIPYARKVKFRRFTCIKMGNERFAPENSDYFFHLECF